MSKPSKPKIPLEFLDNLRIFHKKFFYGKIEKFGIQKKFPVKGFMYDWVPRNITQEDLVEHFYLHPIQRSNHVEGSLAFQPVFKDDMVKWIVFDIDDAKLKERTFKELLPLFDKYNIDYIIEHGGDSNDRCHIWIMCEAPQPLVKNFIRQLLAEINEPAVASDCKFFNKELSFDEIYPVNKTDNLIRLPGGYHLKRGRRYPIEKDGVIYDDPVDLTRIFIEAKPLTQGWMEKFIKTELLPQTVGKKKVLPLRYMI